MLKSFSIYIFQTIFKCKGCSCNRSQKTTPKAIAMAGAAVTVINGPDVDIANIAIAKIMKSMENLLFAVVGFI